jgi:hypothetical protein
MVKAHEAVLVPSGLVNTTDLDSRPMRTHGYKPLQGYNAQLAVNDGQVVIAAELTCDSPDFGHLEPMVRAAQRELRGVEVGDPGVVVADAGYWHQRQIETVVSDGIQVLVSPDSSLRRGARPGWTGGLYDFTRRVLATPDGRALYRQRQATIEPVFGQLKFNRQIRRSNAADERPAGRNGGSSPPPTICSSSTATGSSRCPSRDGRVAAEPRPPNLSTTRTSGHREFPDSLACLRHSCRRPLAAPAVA